MIWTHRPRAHPIRREQLAHCLHSQEDVLSTRAELGLLSPHFKFLLHFINSSLPLPCVCMLCVPACAGTACKPEVKHPPWFCFGDRSFTDLGFASLARMVIGELASEPHPPVRPFPELGLQVGTTTPCF